MNGFEIEINPLFYLALTIQELESKDVDIIMRSLSNLNS